MFYSAQLQEIFRKKNEKKGRKGDAEKSAQLVRQRERGIKKERGSELGRLGGKEENDRTRTSWLGCFFFNLI